MIIKTLTFGKLRFTLNSSKTIQNYNNSIIIINNVKDHQIKYKSIHKHGFNLSLHEHDQPQPVDGDPSMSFDL